NWLGITGTAQVNCKVDLPCAVEPGRFAAVDGEGGFTAETAIFTPDKAGLFRSDSGEFLAVNTAPDRFQTSNAEGSLALFDETIRSMGLTRWLLIAAAIFLAADAMLRLRFSGRRALPALGALALTGAAIAGLAFPQPFARAVTIPLLPEGSDTPPEGL